MRIEAAVCREGGAFSVEAVDLAEPQAHEVLVEIVACGVCHTDLAVRDRHIPLPLPAVLGHEGSGIVSKVGSAVTHLLPGDHVVLSYGSCGQCTNCASGRPAYCREFLAYNVGTRRPDGSCTHHQGEQPLTGCFFYQSSFATHAITHARNVVKVASDLPLEILAPLGCGIQTGAGAVLNCLPPNSGSSIAIYGAGAVGLSAIMAASAVTFRCIIAVDVEDRRLAFARELGATHIVNARSRDVVAEVRAVSGGGTDYAIEATGVPSVMTQAFDALNGTGTAIILGVAPAGANVTIDAATLLGGRTIRGAIEGESIPQIFIPKLIDLWKAGKFPFDRLLKFYPFSQINDAAHDSERGLAIKPVLRMPTERARSV